MQMSRELSVLVLLTHTDSKSIQSKGLLKLKNGDHADIVPVPNVVAINEKIRVIKSEWTLLVSEFETVTEDVLLQVHLAASQSPATQVFFLQDAPIEIGYRKALSPFMAQLSRVSPFGILFRTSYLRELGGLSEKDSHAFDLALFLRLVKGGNPPIAGIPKETFTSILNQQPASLMGPARVRQATDLTEPLAGKTSSVWFSAYARQVEQKLLSLKENDENKLKLTIRLSALASQISHQIFQADQIHLSAYLNRSVYDTASYREQAKEVDDAVVRQFGKEPQLLTLDESLHCFALGQDKLCAQTLRHLGLKRVTGPLDWNHLSLECVAEILQDRFERFLDQGQYFTLTNGGNLARAVEHRYYLDRFNLRAFFPHSDPRHEGYYAQMQHSVKVFTEALSWDIPAVLVYLSFSPVDLKALSRAANAVRSIGPKNSIICIELVSPSDLGKLSAGKCVEFVDTGIESVTMARLQLKHAQSAQDFDSPTDHLNLARLIHGSVMGLHGNSWIQ